jgi:hypothetical protein
MTAKRKEKRRKEGEADEAVEEEEQEEVTYTMSMEDRDRDSTGECPKCSSESRTGTACGDISCTGTLTKSSSKKEASSHDAELRNVRAPQSSSPTSEDVQVGTIRKDQRDMRREQYQARRSNSISERK